MLYTDFHKDSIKIDWKPIGIPVKFRFITFQQFNNKFLNGRQIQKFQRAWKYAHGEFWTFHLNLFDSQKYLAKSLIKEKSHSELLVGSKKCENLLFVC